MQIQRINNSKNATFKNNITFDIGGSQREGSCKIYAETTTGNKLLYKTHTTVNELGHKDFADSNAFINQIVEKIEYVQKQNSKKIDANNYNPKEKKINNIAIFLPSYTSGTLAYYLPNHRNGKNRPLKDLEFKNLPALLANKGIAISSNLKIKVVQDALGTGLAMAKRLYDMGKLRKGAYYTACITGGGCGISNIEVIDKDNIIVKSSGSNYLSQSLSLQKVSRAGASAPAVIENFCRAFGFNDEEIEEIKSCHKAEFTLKNPIKLEKDVNTEKLKNLLIRTGKYKLVDDNDTTFTLKAINKNDFHSARRNAIDKYCLAFARLAIIKKAEGSNGLIVTGPLANSINRTAKKHYNTSVSEWITNHLKQSFNCFELEKMQETYNFKVYCGNEFAIENNTDCGELIHKAKFVNPNRGNWLKITEKDLKNFKYNK